MRDDDGQPKRLRTPTLFVGNNPLQFEQVGVPEAESVEGGELGAIALRPLGRLAMLGLLAQAAMGRLGEMVIWGADGESKALEYIEQGKMTGTIYTNCFDQGKTAFRLMLYALNSEIQPSTFTATPVVKMSPIVATKDNLDLIPASIRW